MLEERGPRPSSSSPPPPPSSFVRSFVLNGHLRSFLRTQTNPSLGGGRVAEAASLVRTDRRRFLVLSMRVRRLAGRQAAFLC